MDPVTLIGIVAVAVMFLAGVTLVGMGLRRHPGRMPEGAADILNAVANGNLASPPARTLDLTTEPKLTKRPASTATAKPLPEILAEREPVAAPDLVRPPASPPRAESATPAVRLIPRPAATGTTVVAERATTATATTTPPAVAATPPAAPVVPRTTPAPAPTAAAREIAEAAQIVEPAPEAETATPLPDSTALFVADLNKALFEEPDNAESDAARSFLDAEPKLQRF